MTTDPVEVIGGGLAGMAAAARLAKAGHPVELHEQRASLGGRWASYELGDSGVRVDDAPSVLGFPAPWRDLFRKSGRPLEAELARSGYALTPASHQTLVFHDGTTLTWPTDRGEQFLAVGSAYGRLAAERWRTLVDRLDDLWQVLRPLGLELELDRHRLTKPVRRQLLDRQSLAELAETAGHPHLTALVRSLAYRSGSTPEQTPALVAVELSVLRTFGRWQVERTAEPTDSGRSSVLVEALTARLQLRKVAVRLNSRVSRIVAPDGRAASVLTDTGERPAAAVICTTDPWQTFEQLLPRAGLTLTQRARQRAGLRRLRPALAPTVRHELVTEQVSSVGETVTLSSDGIPTVSYLRPAAGGGVRSVHDFGSPIPSPGFGLAWRGFSSWVNRPPIRTAWAGVFTAGPFSPGGPGPSQTVLSGALASYACHDLLSGS